MGPTQNISSYPKTSEECRGIYIMQNTMVHNTYPWSRMSVRTAGYFILVILPACIACFINNSSVYDIYLDV